MRLRVGTFNVENLLTRHRFEPGGRAETAAAMAENAGHQVKIIELVSEGEA